jgi:hypothetical protein
MTRRAGVSLQPCRVEQAGTGHPAHEDPAVREAIIEAFVAALVADLQTPAQHDGQVPPGSEPSEVNP